MANILISPSKYVQGAGELGRLGGYASAYGKSALALITDSGCKRVGAAVEAGFAKAGMTLSFERFHGECSKKEMCIRDSRCPRWRWEISAPKKRWSRSVPGRREGCRGCARRNPASGGTPPSHKFDNDMGLHGGGWLSEISGGRILLG